MKKCDKGCIILCIKATIVEYIHMYTYVQYIHYIFTVYTQAQNSRTYLWYEDKQVILQLLLRDCRGEHIVFFYIPHEVHNASLNLDGALEKSNDT